MLYSAGALLRRSKPHKTHQSPLVVTNKRASSHQPSSGPSPSPPRRPHSNQTGPQSQDPTTTRPKGIYKKLAPVYTQYTICVPTTEEEEEETGGPKFFQHGVGTQLMLASLSSSAKAMLMDSARRLLGEEEIQALTERLKEVRRGQRERGREGGR